MTKSFTGFCECVDCDLDVLWVELKQIQLIQGGPDKLLRWKSAAVHELVNIF